MIPSGFDPASNRPAVAVSRDGGRTWTTAELPGAPPIPAGEERVSTDYLANVVSWDGERAFATLRSEEGPDTGSPGLEFTVPIYRSDDGGATWQPVGPWHGAWASAPMMTADGRLVMASGAQRRLVYDGERFELTSLPGLPDYVAGDGRIAFDHDAVFVSDDGWTWRELWRSSICRQCRTVEPPR